ncbi:hypothetical protein [Aquitalea sp. ASV11]|nr:hypothetical protein [Aquitalea sp. ASV11]
MASQLPTAISALILLMAVRVAVLAKQVILVSKADVLSDNPTVNFQ